MKLQLALHLLLLIILQLHPLPLPPPPLVSNSSCLFTGCQPLDASYCTVLLEVMYGEVKNVFFIFFVFSVLLVVQLLSHIQLFAVPWTACSKPGFLVLHSLLEFAQTHVH